MNCTVYFPRACLYAFHCALSICKPVCVSLSFPARASMYFNVYFPCACLYVLHCLLSFRMHLCISLCTCLMNACMHFTFCFPCAVELCRTERLYRRNPSQCFREKPQQQLVCVCVGTDMHCSTANTPALTSQLVMAKSAGCRGQTDAWQGQENLKGTVSGSRARRFVLQQGILRALLRHERNPLRQENLKQGQEEVGACRHMRILFTAEVRETRCRAVSVACAREIRRLRSV